MHPGTKDAAHQKYNSITYASQSVALLLVMLLVELQNTCKKGWTEKRSNICYIFEKMRVQGCQIWHSHSTRPQITQLVPTMQKSSLRHHFRRNSWKLGSQNLLLHAHFNSKFTLCDTSNTQKMTENGRIRAKNGKKCTVENCGTTYPKSKNNCS